MRNTGTGNIFDPPNFRLGARVHTFEIGLGLVTSELNGRQSPKSLILKSPHPVHLFTGHYYSQVLLIFTTDTEIFRRRSLFTYNQRVTSEQTNSNGKKNNVNVCFLYALLRSISHFSG